jgi:H+-translocating NAD(P) transhydrogenase subunit alpha
VSALAFIPYLFDLLLVLALAIFVGFEVISKVPTTLHTPLMSATNAIHGVVLVGAIFIVGAIFKAELGGALLTTLAFVAVILGTINVVGGFAVTERMLQMFKKKEPVRK